MSSVPPRSTQALDDVEQGKATSLSEKPGVTSRPSRSRSVRSTRSETQVSGSSTSGEAEVGLPGQPTRLRSAIGGTLRRNPSPAKRWWARVRGKDRKKIGWMASLKAIVLSSWLNIFLIFIPFAWAAHFVQDSNPEAFEVAFLAIMPLEKLFDFGGEQLAMYCGEDIGDLILITLNNAVEATLAIILLVKCELKLLQSTVVGVVLLHLLLIPGTTFLIGGARIIEQQLHHQRTQLNHTLLTFGILSLIVPAAFFAALDRGEPNTTSTATSEDVITDAYRGDFLKISRGSAILLLIIYVFSRWYLHNPPGEGNALQLPPDAPAELKEKEEELAEAEPEVNPWACIILLLVANAIMAVTAEFLVESIEFVRESGNIREEWFGLILLPIVSFAADGAVAVVYFLHTTCLVPTVTLAMDPPTSVAEARAIDLSIQFLLFWMPFLVLLGWWTHKPMSLLFDLFEVTVLIGSCFLVNYVTADAKTNWAEGTVMIAFYLMIALAAWFYTGQPEIEIMNVCRETIAAALSSGEVPVGE
ncbi:uncharacterized protein STEHIDRAFT_60432 [Stereum hirsutum FP-91666 SS1]|uniref:uncharacterized protein n=1 Tax=Stereum hirsutum (strain FP-91666) TaxID=721885 RepID=UPI00044496F3|nr:uncharacterized protein STEHIDRAFT_60432 [Stereum hirsutum FP-91666 SS1]EIM84946.1 hypothetical protein STEHIDRAFT_60432 [Stereum hirsutum FP-91666 SS1]